jgi:hypothetical protein
MITYTPTIDKILQGLACPYCDKPSKLVDSIIVYKVRSYGMIYHCVDCDAYCGVHKGTTTALGRLANKELRHWKKEAHAVFDLLWKGLGLKSRNEAYAWLSKKMNISPELTHIGMFDVDDCKKVVDLSNEFLNDSRRLDVDESFPIFK